MRTPATQNGPHNRSALNQVNPDSIQQKKKIHRRKYRRNFSSRKFYRMQFATTTMQQFGFVHDEPFFHCAADANLFIV